MNIREASESDFELIWPIFHEVVKAGDTYAYAPSTSKSEAKEIWLSQPRKTYVYYEGGNVLGTYYLKTNQVGAGSHVCNCGYMVSSLSRGKGIATLMCEHSQKIAQKLGYKAMQFNFVAESNVGAIKLWQKLGFEKVGCLPKAFKHATKGYIDAIVMYKWMAF